MYPYIYLGTHEISTYYIMAALGSIAGFLALIYNTRSLKRAAVRAYFLFAALIFIPFYAGARGGFLIECLITKNADCVYSFFGPASLWPGLIVATLFAFPVAAALNVDVWRTADLFAPSIAIGGVFARLGCLMRGCCFGVPCSPENPFATYFSLYSSASNTFGYTPLYPVQFFSSLAWLFNFCLLMWYFKRKRFKGEIILIFTFIYSSMNLIIDFFRFHQNANYSNRLFSVFFIVLTPILYYILYRRYKSGIWK